jgi:hypothetical protein
VREAVIYDFHGTLANVSSIRHLLAARDYDGFYAGSLSCPPIESTVLAARWSHEAGYANLLLTGMPDRYASGLSRWLQENGVPIDLVFMRTREDGFKKDFIVKKRMYLDVVDRGYYVVRAWEDSPAVVDLWKLQGIPVDVVPGYNEKPMTGQVDTATITP